MVRILPPLYQVSNGAAMGGQDVDRVAASLAFNVGVNEIIIAVRNQSKRRKDPGIAAEFNGTQAATENQYFNRDG